MEMSSIGSPLMTLAAFAFTMLLSFSSSVVLSESTSRNPAPPPPRPSPPPPYPATINGSLPRLPRPLKENHGYRHHPLRHPPPPSDKHSESTAAKKRGLNTGKLVGLMFAGIVVVFQIGAVSFLACKRNQLYKNRILKKVSLVCVPLTNWLSSFQGHSSGNGKSVMVMFVDGVSLLICISKFFRNLHAHGFDIIHDSYSVENGVSPPYWLYVWFS